MPATAPEATRVQPTTAGDNPDRGDGRDAERPDLTTRDWPQIARVLTATDEDDVPVFGRLPA